MQRSDKVSDRWMMFIEILQRYNAPTRYQYKQSNVKFYNFIQARSAASMFPTEIYWAIMTHLPFESSLKVAHAINLSDWDAYIYHSIQVPESTNGFDYFNTLYVHVKKMIRGRSMAYYRALMKNSSVKRINDLILFFLCCSFGDLEEVMIILKTKDVDPGAWLGFGIRLAAQHGHVQVVERLLQDARVDPSRDNQFALQKATYHGHFKIVELLLKDDRVDPSVWNNYLVVELCKNGKIELLKNVLTDDRVDPSDRQNESIHMAAKYGRDEILKILLQDTRVDPCSKNNRALKFACSNGHLQAVKILLKDQRVQSSEINQDIITQTFLAKHFEILRLLCHTFKINY
jgi:hypothetical protein